MFPVSFYPYRRRTAALLFQSRAFALCYIYPKGLSTNGKRPLNKLFVCVFGYKFIHFIIYNLSF